MLSIEFLEQQAKEKGLTKRQTEVLVEIFHKDKTQEELPDSLHISPNTLKSHLNIIYDQFGIEGRGPGKLDKLRSLLAKEYQIYSCSLSVTSNASDASIAEILRIIQGIQKKETIKISSANLITDRPTRDNWKGRDKEIQDLRTWLADAKIRTIGIQGLSGVGKSWLAAYLYESIDRELKFWADVRQGTDFTVFAQNVLLKLTDKSPEELLERREPEELIIALLNTLKQRSCLLVIDNLETLLDQDRHFIASYKEFFRRWIEHGTTSKLLITTQTQPAIMEGHCCWLALQGLEATDGATLLQELGIVGSNSELQDFSKYLNGHPKMLRLVASKLKSGTHIREADELRFRQLDLLLNKIPMPYRNREKVLFISILEETFSGLSQEMQSFFLNLSLYRLPFDRDAAVVILADNEESASAWETQQTLDELISRSLLDEIQGERRQYQFHPFVLQYAKQKVGNQPEALRKKIISYYQSVALDSSTWETLEDLTLYIEIFYQYCELKEYAQAFYTIFHSNDDEDCENFLRLSGYNYVRASLYEQLVQSWQPNESEMWELQLAFTRLGDALYCLGKHALAIKHHREALKIAWQIDYIEGVAGSLINIGLAYKDLKDYRRAFQYTRKGIKFAELIDHTHFIANGLNNLGIIFFENNEYYLAIGYYERSQTIKQDIGLLDDAASLINLGDAYRCLEQYDRAIPYLEQGIYIAKQNGDRLFEANGWSNLALALEEIGKKSEAITAYENAYLLCQLMELNERVQEYNNCIQRLSEDLSKE
ncbi:tetratricopeptide repeat protein [Phormidium sp. LEGE 05292]|uniref:tetratricopeptide repeat protein n=1 Tax=[Phormidium] sp. LEGE 05292 TaxID=767427 RepID=UPI00187FD9D1|nr:tetratricopeptide repeat protein [Phormidium sp. LEGE 05292]MBE9225985.1 tetratricopeptide repeat protein [Phormidium sp. LEGE 05292]